MADEVMTPATLEGVMKEVEELEKSAKTYYKKLANKITEMGEPKMAEILNPSGMIMSGPSNDGLLGGGGLIGGLILGSLLRNNGNLLGGDGAGGAVLRSPPEQVQANMSLMQAIGGVDKSVAVASQAAETSNALQSSTIQAQLSQVAQATVAQLTGVKEAVNAGTMVLAQQLNGVQQQIMENRYELSKDISNDGEKTRALLVAQYEATLNRQLGDANARIIALENRAITDSAARGVEVTTTNNINQMQQQAQQQAQYHQLASWIHGLSQQIRSTNEAINVGSGTLTASPTNTNTNIR